MNAKKLWPILSVLVVLTMLGAACAAPTAAPAPTTAPAAAQPTTAPAAAPTTAPAAAAGTTEITVWSRFPEIQTTLQALGDAYTKTHPNIKVTVTLFAQRALDDKIAVALPSGQGPDIVENDAVALFAYEPQGAFAYVPDSLASYVKQHVLPNAVANATNDQGQMFNIPLFVGVQGIYVNTDYMKEAGLTGCPTTVDDLMQWAQKMTKYDSTGAVTRAGFSYRLSGGGYGVAEKFWALAMIPYGVAPWKQVGKLWTNGFDNNATEQAATVNAVMMYVDGMSKTKVDSADLKADSEGFGLGLSAMFQRESSVISYLAQNAPNIHYDVCLMPKGPGGWGTGASGSGLSVTKTSKNQAAAFDFMQWLLSPENQLTLLEQSGWLPVNKDGDYSAVYQKTPQYQGFIKALNTPGYTVYFYPQLSAAIDLEGKMADLLVPAFVDPSLVDNTAAVKTLVDKMAQQVDQVLSDNSLLAPK